MQLTVKLKDNSYPITIAADLFSNEASFSLHLGQRALIVTNNVVAPLYSNKIKSTLEKLGIVVDTIILPDGEKYKTLATLDTLFTHLLEHQYGRDTTLIALGGGVIGDITGFAAACYQRGVPFIQIPTTLLAQVDSSVGGKTGVNHPLGKNMIGAFYQPKSVIIDINSLETLPQREFSAGLAEVIKYGIILDRPFFFWIKENIDRLFSHDKEALTYCIARCCRLKADIVQSDEKEQGVRALLNLGHTFGHAIETLSGYGKVLHGEAVAIGIMMATHVAYQLGKVSTEEMAQIRSLLLLAKLPIQRPSAIPIDAYLPSMMKDKKVLQGKLRFIIPNGIGDAVIEDNIAEDTILAAIRSC